MKKYNLCFDIWGLVLFLAIMIPNFIWFAIPAPKDILRTNSITETNFDNNFIVLKTSTEKNTPFPLTHVKKLYRYF